MLLWGSRMTNSPFQNEIITVENHRPPMVFCFRKVGARSCGCEWLPVVSHPTIDNRVCGEKSPSVFSHSFPDRWLCLLLQENKSSNIHTIFIPLRHSAEGFVHNDPIIECTHLSYVSDLQLTLRSWSSMKLTVTLVLEGLSSNQQVFFRIYLQSYQFRLCWNPERASKVC